MNLDPATEHAVIAFVPSLRAFALSLCRNRDRADELVQETLASAAANIRTRHYKFGHAGCQFTPYGCS